MACPLTATADGEGKECVPGLRPANSSSLSADSPFTAGSPSTAAARAGEGAPPPAAIRPVACPATSQRLSNILALVQPGGQLVFGRASVRGGAAEEAEVSSTLLPAAVSGPPPPGGTEGRQETLRELMLDLLRTAAPPGADACRAIPASLAAAAEELLRRDGHSAWQEERPLIV